MAGVTVRHLDIAPQIVAPPAYPLRPEIARLLAIRNALLIAFKTASADALGETIARLAMQALLESWRATGLSTDTFAFGGGWGRNAARWARCGIASPAAAASKRRSPIPTDACCRCSRSTARSTSCRPPRHPPTPPRSTSATRWLRMARASHHAVAAHRPHASRPTDRIAAASIPRRPRPHVAATHRCHTDACVAAGHADSERGRRQLERQDAPAGLFRVAAAERLSRGQARADLRRQRLEGRLGRLPARGVSARESRRARSQPRVHRRQRSRRARGERRRARVPQQRHARRARLPARAGRRARRGLFVRRRARVELGRTRDRFHPRLAQLRRPRLPGFVRPAEPARARDAGRDVLSQRRRLRRDARRLRSRRRIRSRVLRVLRRRRSRMAAQADGHEHPRGGTRRRLSPSWRDVAHAAARTEAVPDGSQRALDADEELRRVRAAPHARPRAGARHPPRARRKHARHARAARADARAVRGTLPEAQRPSRGSAERVRRCTASGGLRRHAAVGRRSATRPLGARERLAGAQPAARSARRVVRGGGGSTGARGRARGGAGAARSGRSRDPAAVRTDARSRLAVQLLPQDSTGTHGGRRTVGSISRAHAPADHRTRGARPPHVRTGRARARNGQGAVGGRARHHRDARRHRSRRPALHVRDLRSERPVRPQAARGGRRRAPGAGLHAGEVSLPQVDARAHRRRPLLPVHAGASRTDARAARGRRRSAR